MKIFENKKKRSWLKSSGSAFDSYFHKHVQTVKEIKSLFAKKQQLLGIIGFALQIGVAVGQVILEYSLLYTFAYVALYNIWLINNAKKRNKERSCDGQKD